MKFRYFLAAWLLAFPAITLALIPNYSITEDTSEQIGEQSLIFNQASSQKFSVRYTTNGVLALNLGAANSVIFEYIPTNGAYTQSVTGSVDLATNGQVSVTFTPAHAEYQHRFHRPR